MRLKLNHHHTDLPIALNGFENINRYWDDLQQSHVAKIKPGEYYVTKQHEIIVTVLGSCISACICDKDVGIGGMNHFMLPVSSIHDDEYLMASDLSVAARYGNYAMEHMINDILSHGGQRKYLEVKICGGGRVLKDMHVIDIGKKNIDFVKDYIAIEGLTLLAEDVGGLFPRKVQYTPETGGLRIKKIRSLHNDTIAKRETSYQCKLEKDQVSGEVELF